MTTFHTTKNSIAGVLDREVEIGDDVRPISHHAHDAIETCLWIEVERPNPPDAFDSSQCDQEIGQSDSVPAIATEGGEVLSDEVELFDSLSGELSSLVTDLIDWPRLKRSSNCRDGAEGAAAGATVSDLYVRRPRAS
jgi:hypothetical protein